ncbi:MAG: hypothetical protein LBS53_11015 [Synergistaceae bacterium]|jgi:hypothetical protein|nr:hypothetical protein [Synergistaceae bacterium]
MKRFRLFAIVSLALTLALSGVTAYAAGSHDEALEVYNGRVYVLNSRGGYPEDYEAAVVIELNESDFTVARPPVTLENTTPPPFLL